MTSVHVLRRGQHSEETPHTCDIATSTEGASNASPHDQTTERRLVPLLQVFFFFSRRDERGYNATYLDFGFEQFQHGYVEGI